MVNIREKAVETIFSPKPDSVKTPPEMNADMMAKTETITALPQIFSQVIKMTESTLDVEAASILLFRNNDQELFFEAATGPVGRTLRQVKLNTQYGIAGQVARTGKPLIVNDVARSKNFHKMIDDTTGYATQSLVCAPLCVNKKILSVIEVLNKRDGSSFGERDLDAVVSVANAAAMAIENTRLYQSMVESYKTTLEGAAMCVDMKGPYKRGHSQRVMEYASMAGAVLSFSPEEMEALQYGALLHDIGKLLIDSSILTKSGPLTPKEWDELRRHPNMGFDLMAGVPMLVKARTLILHHHERYDGKGYPDGLKGEDIPMGSRIIAVANSYDSMTNDSLFRPAQTIEDAVKELHDNSSTKYCPVAVKALISGLRLNVNRP
jgi:HD-GYP domain-containing protein (c-di-GMP phosphodiesterase class II)